MIARISRHRAKTAIIGVVVLLLIFGIYKIFFASNKSRRQVQTQKVDKGTVIATVSGSGTVSSANSIPVNTQVTGVVTEVYVKNGDSVKSGDQIAKIELDQSSLQKQTTAWATYLSAVNTVKTSQSAKLTADAAMWADQQSVLDSQNAVNAKNDNNQNATTKKDYTDLEKQSIESALIGSKKSFTAAEQKYKDADAAVAAAQAALSSAYLTYQQTQGVILAPISGTVNGLTLRSAMAIASSSNSSSSTSQSGTSSTTSSTSTSNSSSQKVAVIQTDTIPSVSVNASEIDVAKLKEDQRATITLDALPDKTFAGHIVSIDTTGSVSSGVTTYPVVIAFDSEAAGVYPNMAAMANIITQTKDDVLLVPSSAVQTQNGQSTVRVQKNGQTQTIDVETGINSDSQTEIVSGLSEGDNVVTSTTSTTGATTTGTSASPFGASPFGGGRGGFGTGGGDTRRAN